ncbi:unnamed protein product [Caenorhabditis bovis]|uniref:Uncharacterized protein n=1 Tax=Caenorhabditis bovis TaxID=2654633 RepID=A0A8S1ENX2_9PELO|nr:unnamed protein product [Caenorhabditis bovis]
MSDEEEQYSSSSQLGFRRSSVNTSGLAASSLATGSRDEFSSVRYPTSSFSRDSSLRDSLPTRHQSGRQNSFGGPSGSSLSPRVTRDEQTVGLLERYGNSGARKTSVGESPTSQYLKRRQQQQQQSESDIGFGGVSQRRQSLENMGAAAGMLGGALRDRPGASSSLYATDRPSSTRQQPHDAKDITQNEYIARLMAAHNRVDDLLRSRGLSAEDEKKYLRAWEEIPIIREERYRRVRTPSSSSDSGLSTDNDSDRSNAAAPASAEPEETSTSESFILTRSEDETQILHTWSSPQIVKEYVSYSETLHSNNIRANEEKKRAVKSIPTHPVVERNRLTIAEAAHKDLKSRRHEKLCTQETLHLKKKENELVSLTVALKHSKNANEQEANCRKLLRNPQSSKNAQATIPESQKTVRVRASFDSSVLSKQKASIPERRKSYENAVRVQQKNVLASLKRKKLDAVPCTAEISIQHCSFYTQHANQNFAEKNVRLNLRMTERAPKESMATIVLPAPPRIAFARLDVTVLMQLPPIRRTKTQELKRPKQIGKINRSFTMDLDKEEKEQRKVNRLKIPEYFLQSNAEIMEDIKGVKNGLKRVPIIGGFLIAPKPKEPQSTLKRAGAIRRKPMSKDLAAEVPYSDFCPPSEPDASKIPKIRIDRPPDPDPPPLRSRRPAPLQNKSKLAGYLNLHGSLARSATPSGALNNESQQHQHKEFAELSETDKILIERYRSRIHIPRPSAIIRAFSPFNPFRVFGTNDANNNQQTTFLQRRAPRRRSPTPSREPRPIRLKPSLIVKPAPQRRHRLDFQIELKRVDFEKHRLRKKPHHRLIRWIPRWRRRGTDEEVEEVEEEEEEEAVEGSETRSERPKTKSFNEDVEGLTEGEKAMAAAKRRHQEEDEAKLMDYEERRRIEREKEEEELKKLKEKQERRRIEREQEEKEMEEKRKAAEDRRRQEEEERKAKLEEEKRRKEEEKNKRNQMMGGGFNSTGGRSFVVPKKSAPSNDKFGNIVQAKQEMGMTKEQQEDAKRGYMANIRKGIPEASDLLPSDLKQKIKELHQRICKLEADKYDLEKRHERQEYDLKELNERQRQVTRNAALRKGIDPAEVGNSKYPPKVQIVSKYDRQIDRRNFRERRSVFDKRNAHPCFPGVAPPPAVYEKIISPVETEEAAADEEEEE